MIGKCLGVLFTDGVSSYLNIKKKGSGHNDPIKVFASLAYNAKDSTELAYGVDEFLSQTIIIPSGKWSLDARLEPNQGALV